MARGGKATLRDLYEERVRDTVTVAANSRQVIAVETLPGDALLAAYLPILRHLGTTAVYQGSLHVSGAGDTANESVIEGAIQTRRVTDFDGNNATQVDLVINNHTGSSRDVVYVVYRMIGLGPAFA